MSVMKRFFTLFFVVIAFTTVQAADYQLTVSYARAYVMDAEKHQFQLEFVDMETYDGQGSVLFCGKDNNHLAGEFTIDGSNCTATLVVGAEETFEAASGSITIEYSHEANYMSNYNISGLLTDKSGKTLELTGTFGSYAPYDYNSYYQYMMGNIDYTELVSYELLDKNDVVKNYSLSAVGSVAGYSMYNYYKKQGFDVANWRLNLIDENGKQVGAMVVYTEDDTHLVGTYDCKRNSFTYYDGNTGVEANTGMYTITFDHKTDSISYYNLKGELTHKQGAISIDCVLPIGLLTDYQSMADNYSNPDSPIIYVELKDYENSTGIRTVGSAIATTPEKKVYNLSGQRVDKYYKGVVIINGRKVIQK